jgi:hypothetical protein
MFGECIYCSVYACFAKKLFVSSFLVIGQRNNHVLDPPTVARSILKNERTRNMKQQQENSFFLTMTYSFLLFDQCFTL